MLPIDQRNTGIGGSDMAAVLNINPYCTSEEMRLIKLGRIAANDEENQNTKLGKLFEPIIAQLIEEELGVKLRRQNHTIRNSKYPWLYGHIDRRIVGQREGVEIKNANWWMRRDWGEPGTDEIPAYYLPQPHTYMLLLDFQRWHTGVLLGGNDLKMYTIERDKEMDELIIEHSRRFWEVNVKQDKPCAVDWSTPGAEALLAKLYPGTDGTFKRFDMEHPANAWRDQLQTINEQIGLLEKEKDRLDRQMLNAIGNSSGGVFADGSGYERKKIWRKAFKVDATSYYVLRENRFLQDRIDILEA